MGVLGISLIAATVVLFCLRRPPAWLSVFLRNIQQSRLGPPPQPPLIREPEPENDDETELDLPARGESTALRAVAAAKTGTGDDAVTSRRQFNKADVDQQLMPPPPARPPVIHAVTEEEEEEKKEEDGQITPKAPVLTLDDNSVPQFALSEPESPPMGQASSSSSARQPGCSTQPPPQRKPNPPPGLMAPPPRPVPSSLLRPHQPGSSTLPSGPVPNRSPFAPSSSSSSSLFPPPTLAAKPKKPSKEIALAPGHSPLDWARLSSDPTANLRGLPPQTPYIKVTPSMLKKMTGRKGKDAWTVLGGRVYNMTPYLPFHPGGEPELLRGAGRDGTKLFGEIHPWVNYENMLSACLIGIYVPEEEEGSRSRAGPEHDMEAMD
ncbi:cytochrome b5 reductase 4 [Rhypophila decipiens]